MWSGRSPTGTTYSGSGFAHCCVPENLFWADAAAATKNINTATSRVLIRISPPDRFERGCGDYACCGRGVKVDRLAVTRYLRFTERGPIQSVSAVGLVM